MFGERPQYLFIASRRAARSILRGARNPSTGHIRTWVKVLICLVIALVVPWMVEDLDPAPSQALFILLFAAGLWLTEAIPSFAVALLVIGLEIMLLGGGGAHDGEPGYFDWEIFVAPWSSPLIWLFFGGFVLSAAAQRTQLDQIVSMRLLRLVGTKPSAILAASMGATFVFSMFMSNTATTAMMMAVIAPILWHIKKGDPCAKALLIGLAFAANIGGMGTIIGSPPNAIAAGLLETVEPIDFFNWMIIGIPPALVLLVVAYVFLLWRYPAQTKAITGLASQRTEQIVPLWQMNTTLVVFIITVGMWLTGSLHGVPTTVVSFIPICLLTATGILDDKAIRNLPWEVLLLLAGGLSLGVAVQRTGLADWIVNKLPGEQLGFIALAMVMAYVTAGLSNFMSNTAAANVMLPITLALGGVAGDEHSHHMLVLPVALAASAAMCFPISTPPNAIVFTTGHLHFRDFLVGGLLIGLLAPLFVFMWMYIIGH